MANQDSTRWWWAAEATLVLAVASMPLCFGGSPEWTLPLLVGASSVALLTWFIGAWKHRRRVTWHRLLWLPVGLSVVALLTVLPLPPGLLAALSPANAELRDFSLVPLGLERWRPLSADAPSTFRALARVLALGSLCFVSVQLGRLEASRRRMLGALAISGALVAIVGFGHLLAGADSLFGLHHFVGNLPLLTFFGNTNHLAAYLAFSATVGLALALDAPSREAAIGWGAVALVVAVGVVLSLSRGGIVSFVITWCLVAALVTSRRQGGFRAALPWLVIGATVVAALGLASEALLDKLSTVSTVERLKHTKVELWPMFWEGAAAWWKTGMGLGAFELAFTRHQTAQLDVTFTHPESLPLQWVSELGVPLTVVFFVAVVWALVKLVRQSRGSVLEQVLLLAVFGAVLHDVFDFALELNALPPALAVALGLVAAKERSVDAEPPRTMVRRAGLVAAAALCLVAVWATSVGLPGHASAEQSLATLITEGATPEVVRTKALERIDRHPSDWVLYATVASRLSTERTPRDTLAWVNRVLFLRPADAPAHVSAARALLVLGQPMQALLEFKTAWLLGDESTLDEGLALAASRNAWDRLFVDRPGLLTRLWERTRALKRPEQGRALLDAVELLPPSTEVEQEALVLEVWQSTLGGQSADVLSRLSALPLDVRGQPDLVVLEARTLASSGRADAAIALVDGVSRKAPADLGLALALAELLSNAGRPQDARAVLSRVQPFASGARARANVYQTEANLWAQEERWGRALDALQTASRIEPGRADLHYRLAEVYERMGSLHSALDEVRKGRLLDSPDGAKSRDPWVARLESSMSSLQPGP